MKNTEQRTWENINKVRRSSICVLRDQEDKTG